MVYRTTSDYCNILGVSLGASVEELKKAYRIKAKERHPDRNKKPSAHEDFILLTEAYEYLVKNGTVEYTYTPSYTTWQEAEQQEVRQRAAQYSNMDYDDFTNTDYYKGLSSLKTVADHLYFLCCLFAVNAVVAGIITAFVSFSLTGWAIAFLVFLPLTFYLIRKIIPFDLDRSAFFESFTYLTHSILAISVLVTVFNLFVFMKIGLQTLVTPVVLISFYAVPILLTFIGVSLFKKARTIFFAFVIAPMLVSILLDINFIFSSNEVKETYRYFNELQPSGRGPQQTTTIILEGNKYEEYPGIRVFMDYEEMRGHSAITYTFKKGLFGLRVMTHYQFFGTAISL